MPTLEEQLAEAETRGRREVVPATPRIDRERSPVLDVPQAVSDGENSAANQQRRIEEAAGPSAGFTLPGAGAVVYKAPKPSNKLFKPRGNIAKVFYDKRDIVGLAGPAGTGKSRGILEKLHLLAEKYPGCRLLIARKVREGLTEAALFTYEDQVLPPSHPALVGPKRSHRQSYLYPNGSVVNVCGLDKPQKIMSTEYDVVYVQEAIECDETDFEFLSTRLRNGVVPYQQLLFDCNPDAPTHWLYQNALAGKYIMYDTEHEDNPRWYEAAPDNVTEPNYTWPAVSDLSHIVGKWTDAGLKYLEKLDALSGARYLRLRKGKWAAAEGQIYDNFDAKTHVVDRFDPPVASGRWVWTVDFGWTKPFVCQMWWIDGDGRAWLWRELYHTQKLVEEHAADALECAGWGWDDTRGHYPLPDAEYVAPLPDEIVTDHDAEGRATLEAHLHLRVTPATKAILEGIDAVKSRLKIAGDGKARLYFMRAGVYEEDRELREAKQPLGTIQEMDSYIWKKDKNGTVRKKEEPIDEYNHGMDAMRYLVCYLDGVTGGQETKGKDVPQMSATMAMVSIVGRTGDRPHTDAQGLPSVRRSGYDPLAAEMRRMSRRDKVEARRNRRYGREVGNNDY